MRPIPVNKNTSFSSARECSLQKLCNYFRAFYHCKRENSARKREFGAHVRLYYWGDAALLEMTFEMREGPCAPHSHSEKYHLLCRWWSREIFASYWSACISCRFCLQPSSYLCPHHTILVIEWVCTWCVLVHGNTTNKSARRRLVAPVNHYVGIKRRSS